MINGIVWAIFLLAISLPSTEKTPVPPLPGPGPSYLKSNTIVCLPGLSASANMPWPNGPPSQRHDHSFRSAFGDRHLSGDGVVLVQNAGSISDRNAGILTRVGKNRFPG